MLRRSNRKKKEGLKPVLVITGCSSGIGLETARYLTKRLVTVYPTARCDEDVRRLREEGFEGAMRLDVRRADEIAEVIRSVVEREGRIDAWFNNAGYGQLGAVEDLPTEALREQFETNLFGLHECTRQVLAQMRRQGRGVVIQHSSVLGLVSLPLRGAYNASKYAVEGLSDTLRLELSDSDIHVTLLDTGPVASRFRSNALKTLDRIDVDSSRWKQRYEAARQGRGGKVPFALGPEAVAATVHRILLSPKPRPRYAITKATVILALLKRFLPTSWLDRVLLRI